MTNEPQLRCVPAASRMAVIGHSSGMASGTERLVAEAGADGHRGHLLP